MILLVLIIIFCISAYQVSTEVLISGKESKAFEELAEQVSGTDASYEPIQERNPDLFGWVYIEGTNINYPVMHTPNDPEYYLHRAFDKSNSKSGTPFLSASCFEGCGNYIIYGHNMKNGKMFSALMKYKNREFYENHINISFDTATQAEKYEVIAAFYSQIYSENEKNVFRYYEYTDLTDKAKFEEYIKQVKEAALYDTGKSAAYGDQLLTLSTCSYHLRSDDGRFVVVAKKVN